MTTQHSVPPSDAYDPYLSPLTPAEGDHLIRLAQTALATHGVLTIHDDSGALIVTSAPGSATSSAGDGIEGATFGLTNLARAVSAHPPQQWPQLVEQHFDCLIARVQHPPSAPPDPEHQLYLRLIARSSVPPEMTADIPEFLPGLIAVPASNQDGTFALHFKPQSFGMTWTEAHRIALTNLNQFTDKVRSIEHDGVQLAVVGDASWAASRALVLDTVLRESLHVENPQHGVLVALPSRHLLMIHVVQDLAVLPALSAMLHLTHDAYEAAPGPLTRSVYLVDQSGWHPATTSPPDRPLRHHLSPHLQTLTQTLANLE
jgi:hypothetical protein